MTGPSWLQALRRDMLAITTPAARELWPGPGGEPWFNYRWEHVLQVERDAVRLLQAVGGDRDVVLAAVWIHDRFQPAFAGEDHGARAADWAGTHLAGLGLCADRVDRVCACVRNHSGPPHSLPETPAEARLLWDADKPTLAPPRFS
jgi:HD superfamily phosphodiesterase